MPWDDTDHRAAVAATETALLIRRNAGAEVDLDPRVVESMALENTGTTTVPPDRGRTGPALDRQIDRALRSGRHERWSSIVWRCRLAARISRANARRQAFTSTGDPLADLEAAGLITRDEAERRAAAVRDGTATPLVGNRAERRAAQRAAHRAAKARRGGDR